MSEKKKEASEQKEEASEQEKSAAEPRQEAPVHGLLAEYASPSDLIQAATRVRDAGFSQWDTYTPFPVHGIDPAMGIKMTRLPWLVFGAGLTGCITGIVLQWWTNAVDYPWIVSGKPFWSVPANIPVIFELTVLLSAFAAIFGMLIRNNLPLLSHPLDLKKRFARVTDDRFFLLIQASDPKYDEKGTLQLLEETTPVVLEELPEDTTSSDKAPKKLIALAVVLGLGAAVPFGLAIKARTTKSRDPRVHVVADMDWQTKYRAQSENSFFKDGRAMRRPPAETVAVGYLEEDDHLYRGKLPNGAWARTFPKQLEPTMERLERGKERWDIYCAPCHGLVGNGDGMINQRATDLAQGTWIPASNIHQDYLRQQPVGQLYDSITQGVRNMPPYGHLIDPEDRWNIIMYLRALQRSQQTKVEDLPPAERGALK